jgi:signal transduction histidine kinase
MPLITSLRLAHLALLTIARVIWTLRPWLWKPSAACIATAASGLLTVQHAAWTTAEATLAGAEYHIPDTMFFLTSHSAPILAIAALVCTGLFLSILQRSKQNAEIVVLELMLVSINFYFLLLAVADSLPAAGADAHRHVYILRMCAEMLRMAFFMFVGHFLALTHQRTVYRPDPNDAPAPIAWSIEERHLGRIWIAFAYVGGLAAIANYATILFFRLRDYHNWSIAAPALPDSPGLSFFSGFSAAIWLTIQLQILSNLYSQVADEERQNSPLARWHLTSIGKRPQRGYVLGLMLAERPRESRLAGPLYKPDEWKAFLVLMIGSLAGMVLYVLEHRFRMMGADYLALWKMKMELLPLVILLPLIYYKMRFVFFDVLIKRGALALSLIGMAVLLMNLLPETLPRVLSWAIAATFGITWRALRPRMERVLDRYLFHRPDYRVLQTEIGDRLRQFDEAPGATGYVTSRLREAFHLQEVTFVPDPSGASGDGGVVSADSPETVSIPVNSPRQSFGWLRLGERPRQEPYQSEDLRVLGAIAAQFGATLEHIEQTHRERALRELAVRAELKALKAQINPHFFFNALNTVADLTQSNPQAAEKTILNLARIFQFALEASRQETVALGREVAFVRSYLEIGKARFEDKLEYRIDVPEDLWDVPVPPMLVQPLVENAVRHGISPMSQPGRVMVTARLHDDRLWIAVEDDGIGFEADQPAGQPQQGVGLSNVAERVQRLAGAGHWQVRSSPGAGTTVRFDLRFDQGAVRCAC